MPKAAHPKRIVCLDPGLTEMLFALGLDRRVVGLADECDFPMRARGKERVGPGDDPHFAAIVALKPDLVLALVPEQRRAVRVLEEMRMPVLTVSPASVEDVCNAMLDIGSWTGREADAYRTVTAIRSPLLRLLEARSGKKRLKVYIEEEPEPPLAAGRWCSGLAAACGAEPFLPAGEPPRPADAKALAAFDPDLIVLLRGEGQEFHADNPAAREGWHELKAAREGRVRYLPREFFRPGPRMVEGARRLARLIDELL